ncbi:PREDICTED: interleukin-2 receptor subunit beta-like [Cyprinodon variegatus]|uniref:Interleukin-2 receptor subunit beta-like n=1 Tax=Cyprinodon variegatus TaxID=28743 RepID=A0A3Q2CC36_CYPVA|nr:PREDICTED: interleukin-2 receptor subunit beta-like [Cyprinodon variegatus]
MLLAGEMLWCLCILLVLPLVHPAHIYKDPTELHCVNDFVNNVSCTWTGSWVDSAEDCLISAEKEYTNENWELIIITRTCKLEKRKKSSLGCSVVFENTRFVGTEVMPSIRLMCNRTLVKEIKKYEPAAHIKMHPPRAPQVNKTSNFTLISWSLGEPVSRYSFGFSYQLQIKQKEQQWENSAKLYTDKKEMKVRDGELQGHLEVRVRVKPLKRNNSHWSEWSGITSWQEIAEKKDSTPEQIPVRWILLPLSLCLIIVLVLAQFKSCKTLGLFKGKQISNPSEYFHSVHQGNLKEWLNPLSGTQSFFEPPPCDQFSHVEVCEDWNETAPSPSPTSSSRTAFFHFQRSQTSSLETSDMPYNSSSFSTFSNKGYFLSSSSGDSAGANPNLTYFTYQDNFQNLPCIPNFSPCDPLTPYPEYESLNRQPESPDSGFGFMKEDEMKETGVICKEGKEVLSDGKLPSPLLLIPLQLPSRPPFSPPATPATLIQPPESPQMDVAEIDTGTSTSLAAQPVSGAMSRSSSMPVEPYETGYMTLKELQMTFSNKSI